MSKKNKKSPNHKKRDLLKLSGLTVGASFFNPLEIFIGSIIDGAIKQAAADTIGSSNSKFILLQQYGAPVRSMYDHFINPYNDTGFITNPYVATKFVKQSGSTYDNVTYATTPYLAGSTQTHVPHIWSQSIPTASGGSVAMSSTLKNLLSIQGINALNSAHPGAARNLMRPATAYTVTGLLADKSTSPIPILKMNSTNISYQSKTSVPIVDLPFKSNSNMLATLLSPFQKQAQQQISQANPDLNLKIERALASISEFSKTNYSEKLGNFEGTRTKAVELIQAGLDDLSNHWDGLLAKYKSLISRSITNYSEFEGFGDAPIGNLSPSSRGNDYRYSAAGAIVKDSDLRTAIPTLLVNGMAERFAVAEYSITRDFSQSVTMITNGSPLAKFKSTTNGNPVNASIAHDAHFIGVMPNLMIQSFTYRAMHACLHELITQLKNKTLGDGTTYFDNSLIYVGGEFNRSPRSDKSGSDHGWQAASASLYSGKIDQFKVIGNTYAQSYVAGKRGSGSTRPGSWGYHAPIPELSNVTLNYGHLASTMAKILNVESPSPNNPSLVNIKNGKVDSLLSNAKLNTEDS